MGYCPSIEIATAVASIATAITTQTQFCQDVRKKGKTMEDKFWCTECGTKRDVGDSVNEIKDGAGLCRYCNRQLEAELGRGVREHVPTRTRRV